VSDVGVQEILTVAEQQQVELWFEGDRLRFRVPSGGLSADLRARLTEHKGEILAVLRQQAAQSVQEFPLSYGQQAMWFLYQTDPTSAAYNVAFTGRISSPLDVAPFQGALQALVDRHPALRITFRNEHGAPVQRVTGYAPVWFEQINAAGWSEADIYQSVRQAYLRPFDLENGPLLRVHLWKCNEQDYILLINVHHIAVDGWSLCILLDELRALYAANTGVSRESLPRPPARYSDFVTWQQEILKGENGERLWRYWQTQLEGELPVLSLPADHPRPPIQTSNGDEVEFVISAEITQGLKAVAKAEGATLFMVLFTAFQILLHRYSGQSEIITGSPTFGRNKAEFAKVVGDFINMIPLRVDFTGDPTFKDLLARVRQVILNGLEHQDFPFPQMVARMGGHRDASRSPIFQVTFDVQRLFAFGELAGLFIPGKADAAVDFGGLKLQAYPFPQQEGQFDLGLLIIEVENVLPGTLKYNTDIFDKTTSHQLVKHYLRLLAAIVANPNQPISSYQLLFYEELQCLLVEWNQTQMDYPRHLCAHQLFEAQVERTPDSIAVIFDDQSLTYRQLNQRANQLAHHLRSLGIGPEKMVGVYLERSLEMVVAVLGVLKSGGAYIPMDPMFPAQRIGYMIEDSQMPVIVTQRSLTDSLPPHNAQFVLMDDDSLMLARLPQENPSLLGDTESLAYTIFTSGSTGRPKGVQIPHRALVNFLISMQHQPGICPTDVLASVTTLSFDIAGLELYLPLISGARLVVLSADTAADGVVLADALENYEATILQATPATWRLLIETGWTGRPNLKMLCGGEPMSQSLAKQLLDRGGELWNMYGPTETTIWSTICHITPEDTIYSIGRPIANTQVYILDNHLQPLPVGVSGALYIGGDGLARGYLGRPDLTAKSFIPVDFPGGGDSSPRRIYNTGDLARYLPDGRIECLGRNDSQVKIRGFRIELGEIEAVLSQHPAIKQAVVIVREDIPGDKRLVAYLTAENENAPASRELRNLLHEKLPPYMLPAAYVTLENFPLTPNGKVDRRALPAPVQSNADVQKNIQPPSTPNELIIATAWQKALNMSQVGVYDNFFDLGGHSLLGMQVVADIQEKTGIRIEPAYLRFESLGQLAVTLEEKLSRKGLAQT
jgi:amino acid adenylation domain-containing protein